MKRLLTKLAAKLSARLGYTPTAHYAEAQRLLALEITRVAHYEEMLMQSQRLTQRGIEVIDTLRKVNTELAASCRRLSSHVEYEVKVKRAYGVNPYLPQ